MLGLKHSADQAASTELLSALLAGHRWSAKGLALVPQGTATNNTSDEDAGLDSVDWFADASFAAEEAAAAEPDVAVDLDAASDGDPPGDVPRPGPRRGRAACRTPTGTTTPRRSR